MANTQPGLDIVNDITKIKIGQVASSIFKEGMLKYKIRIEGMHSSLSEIIELSDGIPIFQNGINTKRFENGARVFCLSIGEAIGSVFVVGEVDDSNKKDTVTEGVLSGQNFLSSLKDKSGIIGLGNSAELTIWNNSSIIKLNNEFFSLDVDGASDSIFASQNSVKLKAQDSIFSLGFDSLLTSLGDISILSQEGSLVLGASNIFSSSSNLTKISSQDTIEISSSILNIKSNAFKFKSVMGSAFNVPSIDMSVLSGDIQMVTADGNFEISVLSPIGIIPPNTGLPNKIKLTLGPSLTEVCFMEMKSVINPTITLGIGPSAGTANFLKLSSLGSVLKSLTMKVDVSPVGVHIGTEDPLGVLAEPVVKGTQLNSFLTRLITLISTLTVTTPVGVSSPPNQIALLQAMSAELTPTALHLSKMVKVT